MVLLGMILDVVILTALAAAIFFALRLSKQLTRMQAEKEAFETLISALNTAASRAESAVSALKETASLSSDRLQDKIGRAKALSEELEIMIQAADNLADRLGAGAKAAGQKAEASSRARPAQSAPRTKAEQDLLDAVKASQES